MLWIHARSRDKVYFLNMKKLLLFFNNPILGGLLSLVGLIDILFKIDSSYFTYQISVGLIILILGVSILFSWAYKQMRIYYYIKKYTTGSFGDSHLYKWQWVKTPHYFNVYGYVPDRIEVVEPAKLNPNIKVIDCAHHYINNKDVLQEYIMLSLYDKVENTKQTNLFVCQMHELEAHYANQRLL